MNYFGRVVIHYFELESSSVVTCSHKHQLINILFSALTLQFVKHRFLDYHDPTIGKSENKL